MTDRGYEQSFFLKDAQCVAPGAVIPRDYPRKKNWPLSKDFVPDVFVARKLANIRRSSGKRTRSPSTEIDAFIVAIVLRIVKVML
jgi:hypothetical protein